VCVRRAKLKAESKQLKKDLMSTKTPSSMASTTEAAGKGQLLVVKAALVCLQCKNCVIHT